MIGDELPWLENKFIIVAEEKEEEPWGSVTLSTEEIAQLPVWVKTRETCFCAEQGKTCSQPSKSEVQRVIRKLDSMLEYVLREEVSFVPFLETQLHLNSWVARDFATIWGTSRTCLTVLEILACRQSTNSAVAIGHESMWDHMANWDKIAFVWPMEWWLKPDCSHFGGSIHLQFHR